MVAEQEQKVIRIVIADDHPLLRIGLRLAFEDIKSIDIIGESDNGFETIETIKETKPDVSLIDIDMPGLSGIPVIRIVRNLFPDMIILAISTYHDDTYIRNAMNAGADGFVLKTIDIDGLVSLVQSFYAKEKPVSPYLVNLALEDMPEHSAKDASVEALTFRELEVLQLLATGKNNKNISKPLFLSIETVKTHLKHIFKKLHVSNRFEAVIAAKSLNLIE